MPGARSSRPGALAEQPHPPAPGPDTTQEGRDRRVSGLAEQATQAHAATGGSDPDRPTDLATAEAAAAADARALDAQVQRLARVASAPRRFRRAQRLVVDAQLVLAIGEVLAEADTYQDVARPVPEELMGRIEVALATWRQDRGLARVEVA